MGTGKMTIGEYIMAKSYLPKNGTYTMLEHLQAMEMTVVGEHQKLVVENKKEYIRVNDKKDNVKTTVKNANIAIGKKDSNIKVSNKTQG